MRRRLLRDAALSLALLAAPVTVRAQSAIIYGSLGNFDISNDTGQICHGFEIEIGGVTPADVPGGFSAERYEAPSIVPYAGGTNVRWASPYDSGSQSFVERTLPHTVSWFPGQCYQWNPATYQDSGCEHFGSWTNANATHATHVTARWLCEDNANPGVLVPNDLPTAIPMPNYFVVPPVVAGDPPVLQVEIDAPEPAEAPELYGDAQWMRVYVTQFPREVALEELVADNPAVVPMDQAQLESDWGILQQEPACGGGGGVGGCQNQGRGQKHGSGNIEPTTRSIVRRIELYAFTGDYDPITHEALCADLTCSAPSEGEVGELISTQMTAVNVPSNSVDLMMVGNGNVGSDDTLIHCGSKCVASYDEGTQVTLTANPASDAVFIGWFGACEGTQPTCTVTANGQVKVHARFGSTGGGGGTPSCGLLGIEGLLPFAWFALRRRSQRG